MTVCFHGFRRTALASLRQWPCAIAARTAASPMPFPAATARPVSAFFCPLFCGPLTTPFLTAAGILVARGEQALRILELQREGGRRMNAAEFLKGHAVKEGGKLVEG